MKRSNAVRATFWLGMIFALVFLVRAESGDRRTSMPDRKGAPPIRILDQNGQPAVNGAPSATNTIVDVMVGPGFSFSPDTVNISVGDTVRWTWAGSGHSVTSGPPCQADSQYCSPNDMNCASGILSNSGTVYTHTFSRAGAYSYFCAAHSFLAMGGRTADTAGSDFQHVLQYSPTSNSWTQRGVTLPDNQMNNMACGVLSVSGTPLIYCVGGSAAGQTTATARVFSYNPVTDLATTLTGDDWPGALGTILP